MSIMRCRRLKSTFSMEDVEIISDLLDGFEVLMKVEIYNISLALMIFISIQLIIFIFRRKKRRNNMGTNGRPGFVHAANDRC